MRTKPMNALLACILLVGSPLLAACVPPENEGGTPIPGVRSEAPLNDEAVEPSEGQDEIDDEGP